MLKVVYGSMYGHTKRYAEDFAQHFNTEAVSYKDCGHLNADDYVVYFGALFAGGVHGLSSMKGTPKNVTLVTVGLSDPTNPENVANIKNSIGLSKSKREFDIADVFHLRGGIDYKNLHLKHKVMMKMLYMKAKRTPEAEQSDETKTMLKTYGGVVDFVDPQTLAPIVDHVKRTYQS